MAHREGHTAHVVRGSKQRAQQRAAPFRDPPLWVYDEEDWATMRSLPSGSLICPVPGCRTAFQVPQQQNALGTRFLKNMPDPTGPGCDHALARPELGGGSMSRQHRWLQARLARICASLGHEAIVEDAQTNSDVLVRHASPDHEDLCIEVQRWSTDFEKRTKARTNRGLRVLWLITEDARGTGTNRALFRLPAARVRVHHLADRSKPLTPWDHPEQSAVARLSVYATAAKWSDRDQRLITGNVDAYDFLAEVLDGRRNWMSTLPIERGFAGWALDEDLQCRRRSKTEQFRR